MSFQHQPQDQELLERLNRHPNIKARLDTLLSIAEAAGDDLVKADEAERQTLKAIRRMGHEVLSRWAFSRVEQCAHE